jgi:beta-glucosidase
MVTDMKKILFLSTLFVVFFYCNTCRAKVNPCDVKIGSHSAVTPVSKMNEDWWAKRHQEIVNRVKQGNVDLLLIGDSITHGWDWDDWGQQVRREYYDNRNVLNMGFTGDRTQHVLWRLQNGEIDNIKPKLAIVMIGTNNSNGTDNTPQEIADGIKAIVCELRTKLPQTKILILAIFPRGDVNQMQDGKSNAVINPQWEKNNLASKLASKVADNKMIFYMDINKKFLNDKGVLTREIFPDLLHPRKKGYQIWAEAIEPMVTKLMDEKSK